VTQLQPRVALLVAGKTVVSKLEEAKPEEAKTAEMQMRQLLYRDNPLGAAIRLSLRRRKPVWLLLGFPGM